MSPQRPLGPPFTWGPRPDQYPQAVEPPRLPHERRNAYPHPFTILVCVLSASIVLLLLIFLVSP